AEVVRLSRQQGRQGLAGAARDHRQDHARRGRPGCWPGAIGRRHRKPRVGEIARRAASCGALLPVAPPAPTTLCSAEALKTGPRVTTTELVIFDCDGVLIDSEVLACRVEAEQLSALGVPMTTEDVVRRFAGVSAKDLRATIERESRRRLPADYE